MNVLIIGIGSLAGISAAQLAAKTHAHEMPATIIIADITEQKEIQKHHQDIFLIYEHPILVEEVYKVTVPLLVNNIGTSMGMSKCNYNLVILPMRQLAWTYG